MAQPSSSAKYAAELIGTFFLVFTMGCNIHTGNIGAALSVGAVLMAMIYALSSVSGAHFNPAVTLAVHLSSRDKISPGEAILYMLAQLAGGMAGTAACWLVVGGRVLMHQPAPHYSTREAEAAEFLYTCALCYVVLNVTAAQGAENGDPPNAYSGLAIGMTVAAAGIAVGPISGCSLNPAATMGAIGVASCLQGGMPTAHFLSLYTFAPFMGAVVGAFAFLLVRGRLAGRPSDAKLPTQDPLSWLTAPMTDRGLPQSPGRAQTGSSYKVPRTEETLAPPPSSIRLRVHEPVNLPAGVEDHEMYCQLRWRMCKARQGIPETADIDLSCVKYSRSGVCLGGVYFANQADPENGIAHTGDQVTGAIGRADSEAITFLLSDLKPNVHALFFVAMIYSAEQSFRSVQQCCVRMVDITERNKELCRYEKDDMELEANALIAVMLYRSGDGWRCKAVDESYVLPALSTYRKLDAQMSQLCLQTVPAEVP